MPIACFLVDCAVTMQAHKEMPPDMQCKDKFLVQSVVMPEGAKELNQQMVGSFF